MQRKAALPLRDTKSGNANKMKALCNKEALVKLLQWHFDDKAVAAEKKNSKDETSSKDSQGGQKAASESFVCLDDKAAVAENKNSKDEKSSKDSQGGQRATSGSAPGFPPNLFDISTMSGLLNDPSIKELAEQIAKDPSFNQMAEQLQKTFHGATQDSIPSFDNQQYYSTMQQVMQNPNFMTMDERLGNALMQDPSMSSMLESLTSPSNKDQLEETMARIKEDPSLKHILDEIEIGGPAAMMRYWNDEDVLRKLGQAMVPSFVVWLFFLFGRK